MKRAISFILATVLSLGVFTMSASAAPEPDHSPVQATFTMKGREASASIRGMLEEEGIPVKEDTVIHFGVSIDKNGTVSYFAELEKMGEKQRERIEQAKEERAEEQEKNRKAGGKREDFIAPDTGKRTRVTANSMEELFDKILSVDWDAIKNESQQKSGGRFDFSI